MISRREGLAKVAETSLSRKSFLIKTPRKLHNIFPPHIITFRNPLAATFTVSPTRRSFQSRITTASKQISINMLGHSKKVFSIAARNAIEILVTASDCITKLERLLTWEHSRHLADTMTFSGDCKLLSVVWFASYQSRWQTAKKFANFSTVATTTRVRGRSQLSDSVSVAEPNCLLPVKSLVLKCKNYLKLYSRGGWTPIMFDVCRVRVIVRLYVSVISLQNLAYASCRIVVNH